jgi:cytochrome c biogenesis protein CcmG/thiol:disulfide interchange protein DsbE
MDKIIRFLPLVLVIALGVVLYRGLSLDPQKVPSALIGQPMPDFSLTRLSDETVTLTKADMVGDIMLLNVWATWCPTCKYEHPYLVDISKNNQLKLYGLNYQDDRKLAQQWLVNYKDPYQFSIFDELGSLGVSLGVYGAPETFVIEHHGIIRMRFSGAVDTRILVLKIETLINEIIK